MYENYIRKPVRNGLRFINNVIISLTWKTCTQSIHYDHRANNFPDELLVNVNRGFNMI